MYIRTLPLCTQREGSSQSNQLACSPFCVRLRAYASNTRSTDNIHPMNKIPIAIQVEVQTGRFNSQIGLRIDPTKPQHVSDTAFEPVQDQSTYFVETEAPLKLPVSLSGYKIINDDDWQSIQSLESLTTLVSTSRVATLIDKSATFELQRTFREDVVNWALSLDFEGYLHWTSQVATLIDKSATFELQRTFREDVVNWALSLDFEGYLHWASQVAT
jgi:hypothetical protein